MHVAHPHFKRGLLALGMALVLVAGMYLGRHLACLQDRCASGPGDSAQARGIEGPAPITIGGLASRPMTPGVRMPLNLTLTNTQDVAMTADHLAVTIEQVRAPRATARLVCTVRDFAVVQAASRLSVTLGARQTTTLRGEQVPPAAWPTIGMVDSATNQDGCKGASLRLRYAATGTQVDG